MAKEFEARYRVRDGGDMDADFHNKFRLSVDGRLDKMEIRDAQTSERIDEVVADAQERVDGAILPLITQLFGLQEQGFLVLPVREDPAAAVEFSIGVQNIPTVTGPQADYFFPGAWIALRRTSTIDDWAIARVSTFDRLLGILSVDITHVGGAEGPHDDVEIVATGGASVAELMTLDQMDAKVALAVAAKDAAVVAKDAAVVAKDAAQTAKTDAETAKGGAETAQTGAGNAAGAAVLAQGYSEEWANNAEDVLVSTEAGGDEATEYSALHHAAKAAASAASLTGEFPDDTLRINDDSDPTKQIAFDASGIATGTVRTLAAPDANGTVALTSDIPGAGGTHDFVASGTIANGDAVILNSDGTVSTVVGNLASVGTVTDFESASTQEIDVCKSSSTKVVVVYKDDGNSDYGTAVVGTISGTSISFGTPVVFGSGACTQIFVDSTEDDKVVIMWRDTSDHFGRSVVGTVSGTSISYGTEVEYANGAIYSYNVGIVALSSTKVVLFYENGNASYAGYGIVGTVSGTSISFGTAVYFVANGSGYSFAPFSATELVISYGYSVDGYNRIATVSGTVVSFNTATQFEPTVRAASTGSRMLSATKILIVYTLTATDKAYAVIGTIAAGTITYGSRVEIFDGEFLATRLVELVYGSKYVVVFEDNTGALDNYLQALTINVSGDVITADTDGVATVISSNSSTTTAIEASSAAIAIFHADVDDSENGKGMIFTPEETDAGLWVGIAAEDISDTDTGPITILGGVSSNQSGLTAGSIYYVDAAGDLTETIGPSKIGRAFSATEILIEGDA